MTDLQFDAGTLLLSEEDLTATGLLVPFHEQARSNIGRFQADRESFTIPTDLSGAGLNIEHAREDVVGMLVAAEAQDHGIIGRFKFRDTDEGRAAFEDAKSGKRGHLSVEASGVVIRAGKAIAGKIFGAALVAKPAFPSATLLASAVDTVVKPTFDEVTAALKDHGEIQQAEDGSWTFQPKTTETAPVVPDNTPAPGTENKEGEVGNATPNSTLEASANQAPKRTTLRHLAATLAAVHQNNDRTLLASLDEPDGATLFAALSDITFDYTGAVGLDIIQPAFIGQLWAGRQSPRKYIPLISQGTLSSGLQIKGWKWATRPTVAKWAGNKNNVPSGTIATAPHTFKADRYAGAHDIAREYYDFNSEEFWAAYLQAMTQSYSTVTDLDCLAALVSNATTVAAGSTTGFTAGLKATAAVVDGAIATLAKDVPTFALVGADVYRTLLLQTTDNLISTLSLSLGLEDGSLSGFRIVPVPSAQSAAMQGKVLVGTKAAATAWELPGSPIRVEALDVSRGGVDEGFFGYFGTDVNEPLGLSLVTVAS